MKTAYQTEDLKPLEAGGVYQHGGLNTCSILMYLTHLLYQSSVGNCATWINSAISMLCSASSEKRPGEGNRDFLQTQKFLRQEGI